MIGRDGHDRRKGLLRYFVVYISQVFPLYINRINYIHIHYKYSIVLIMEVASHSEIYKLKKYICSELHK